MLEPPDYSINVDCTALAAQDDDFKAVLDKNGGRMQWKEAECLMALTKALLKRDFHLNLNLPNDRLCPPVPQRYAYIRWIQSLIDSTGPYYSDSYEPDRDVTGIDIGVGASCIYALLGTALRPGWAFLGTEIDAESLKFAFSNVELNNLSTRIHLTHCNGTSVLPDPDMLAIRGRADFVMCNPPFFTSHDDMMATWSNKLEPPSSICTGAAVEMITSGGDLGFAVRMADESKQFPLKVQWYTCMLGKLQSAADLVRHLRSIDCRNWVVHTLIAGNRTRRWVIGWSWDYFRPLNDVARGSVPHKQMLPLPTEFNMHLRGGPYDQAGTSIEKLITALRVQWAWNEVSSQGILQATENVWSRSARRQALRNRLLKPTNSGEMDVSEQTSESAPNKIEPGKIVDQGADMAITLIVKITTRRSGEVNVRWIYGRDYILFESFCGWFKRQAIFLGAP